MASLSYILKRMIRPGTIPEDVNKTLEYEGLLYKKERIWIRAIFNDFKAPGRRYSYKSTVALGALAVSSQRIIGYSMYRMIVHTPFEEPKFKAIKFKAKFNKYLNLTFDPNEFDSNQSGEVQLRFYLKDTAEITKLLINQDAVMA